MFDFVMKGNCRQMKIKEKIFSIIPPRGLAPLVFTFVFNCAVYGGTKLVAADWHHYNIETKLDALVPFVPWTIVIYFGCYIFWIANYILCIRQGRERAYRFLTADILAKVICMIFFLAFPTTNTRPDLSGDGVWLWLMRFLYAVDSPVNLFPSIHCLTSWMCYIGLRGRREIAYGYRVFSCVMAIAVFVSTLTTKQHVIVDVAGGMLLAELCWRIAGHTLLAQRYECFWELANDRIPIIKDTKWSANEVQD